MKKFKEFLIERLKDFRTYPAKIDNDSEHLYHASNNPNLHEIGLKPNKTLSSGNRIFFNTEIDKTDTYGKHLYRINLKHPNLSKHLFTKKTYDVATTRQNIPPGEHLKKIK